MAKLAAERFLTEDEIDMLGGVRQAFKVVRRSIKRGEPVGWWTSGAEPYRAIKSLSVAMSVLLSTAPRGKSQPSATVAARNYKGITDNRHETSWIDAARRIV